MRLLAIAAALALVPSVAFADDSIGLFNCVSTSGQVCSREDGCEAEKATWRFVFTMDPERDGAGALRRQWVRSSRETDLRRDGTVYRLVNVETFEKDGFTIFEAQSGAGAKDVFMLGSGGGFVATKESAGLFTSRMGSCEIKRVERGEIDL